jgi:hypothetical protein
MKRPLLYCAALAGLLLAVTGCANYTMTFQVENVINDGGKGDSARNQLDVDVVCVTRGDAKDLPELVQGGWRSKDWFTARDQADPRLRKMAKRIYALRSGSPGPNDTLLGPPLLSGCDTQQKEVTIHFHHPDALSGDAAIVIFGRFHNGEGGLLNTPPVIFHPPPSWNMKIVIGVGRTGLARLEPK